MVVLLSSLRSSRLHDCSAGPILFSLIGKIKAEAATINVLRHLSTSVFDDNHNGSGERSGDEFEFYIHSENERVRKRKTSELADDKN